MPARARIRGEVRIALNSLVRVDVITGFKITSEADAPFVTVSVAENHSLDEVKGRVMDKLAVLALGISVAAERATEV
jgi:hypothetical protein